MKTLLRTTRAGVVLAALLLCLGLLAQAQDSAPLGDVARKARKEHSSADHVAATHVANGEDDGPDSSGVWRLRPCPTTILCYELSVVLPKTLKWERATNEPRPVLIPLDGYEKDPDRAIRVYAADPLAPSQSVDVAKRTFLQSWFAKPEYFGKPARLALDEHVWIDNDLTITHFSVTGAVFKYHGLSVVAGWAYGNFGFACAYRDEDTSAATSICDAIIRSAKYQILQPAARGIYRDPPPQDPQYDPREQDDL
jgi:hypothetical protein